MQIIPETDLQIYRAVEVEIIEKDTCYWPAHTELEIVDLTTLRILDGHEVECMFSQVKRPRAFFLKKDIEQYLPK